MAVKYLNQHFFKDNEHIHTFFCSANRKEQMHFHEFWELSYVYEGFGKNRTHSQVENVSADDFLLISPGMEHSFSSLPKKAQTRLCNCLITKKYFDAVFKQYSVIHGLHHLSPQWKRSYRNHEQALCSELSRCFLCQGCG